jgi:uncharacterized membrane protein
MSRRNKQTGPPSLVRSHILERNLEMLGHREEAERAKRSISQRLCDSVTDAAGEPWFAGFHAVLFAGWILCNSQLIPGLRPFDPFPFSFLTFLVSLEAIFLSLAILMTQSRENRQADNRAKLDLQINLLAEREATKILQLLQAICRKQGLAEADDAELQDLLRPTNADRVLDELERQSEEPKASERDRKTEQAEYEDAEEPHKNAAPDADVLRQRNGGS